MRLGAPENMKTLQVSKLADPLQPSTGAASAAAAAALLGVDVPRPNSCVREIAKYLVFLNLGPAFQSFQNYQKSPILSHDRSTTEPHPQRSKKIQEENDRKRIRHDVMVQGPSKMFRLRY